LLGKDVKFKDLGVMIIDEEQKFGVAAKEKLKQLSTTVDSLTLNGNADPKNFTIQFDGRT
jgi:transcription-repair coupling factor (superfamily II helicase)